MSPRITRSAMTGASLIALLLALPAPAGARVAIEPPPEQEGGDRPEGSSRTGSEPGLPEQFRELRRLLDQEREVRRQAEERLADREQVILELIEKLARAEVEADQLREAARAQADHPAAGPGEADEPRDGPRPGRLDAPDQARVAEARVEAARSRLEAAEMRLDACRQRIEELDRAMASGVASAGEGFEGRMALADAQAQLAESRAQLVEAEFQLGRVLRGQEGDPGPEADRDEARIEPGVRVGGDSDEHDYGIELEDVVDTADRILDLIRGIDEDFGGDRGLPLRDELDEDFEVEVEVEGDLIDEVFDTADRILDLIQGIRRDRRGR
ncbi:hypothetical protein [Tautonia plasticadhaerens]|uniref:Chromosome partition protein Smc n=1 Tax=Tautonia plasticadhaerens TaxID=2527974 RepID=A0A518H5J1_9BACT|nr:hypothetical protein [Tautonia plasticadhaerens]QDV36105.1 hypothetical protein ElP_40170 [Tautonia plasticadhaerens]